MDYSFDDMAPLAAEPTTVAGATTDDVVYTHSDYLATHADPYLSTFDACSDSALQPRSTSHTAEHMELEGRQGFQRCLQERQTAQRG